MSVTETIETVVPALRATGVRKVFAGPRGPLEVLSGLDLEVPRGMLLAIVGASGAGKSTLLNILGALDHATSGTLEIAGQRVESMGERERCQLRATRLGFVFQFHHLLPEFTAEENVMMPLLLAGRDPVRARDRAREVLGQVGLRERCGIGLLGGQRPIMDDYVMGPGAPRGAGGAGGRSC